MSKHSTPLISKIGYKPSDPIEDDPGNEPWRDDNAKPAKIVYIILLVLFLALLALGLYNTKHAYRVGKFKSKSILLFYSSALSVIILRCILFTDPIFTFGMVVYILILITMPTYLYLIVGLSQVMLSVDCIIKYKNLEVIENVEMALAEKRIQIVKNKRKLLCLYTSLALAMAAIVMFFAAYLIFCAAKSDSCDFEGSFTLVLPLGILQVVIWLLLLVSTLAFI